MKHLPEFHVYNPPRVDRVVWRDESGNELDLTNCRVSRVERDVQVGEFPAVRVTFFATLVEHQEYAS